MRNARRGTVRVGSFGTAASQYLLPPILQTFARIYPDMEVVVTEGSEQEVQQWLRAGEVDLGFVTLPNDEFNTYRLASADTMAGLRIGLALTGNDEGSPACRAFLRVALVTEYGPPGS